MKIVCRRSKVKGFAWKLELGYDDDLDSVGPIEKS